MYKHLLVPTDGSELSRFAVVHAAKFASALGARVTLLNVQPEYPAPVFGENLIEPFRRDFELEYAKTSDAILKDAAAEIERAGVACQHRVVISSKPWEQIIRMAEAEHCDLVFMASHGRSGVAGLLIGSETQKVITHCKIPVLVYR